MKGSCIDLILTSRPSLHQFTNVFETGISDYHLLIYIILKSTYTKMESKVLSKRYFKNFSKQFFLQDLKKGLINTGNFSDSTNEFKNTKILRKEIMKRSTILDKISVDFLTF